MSGMAMTVKKKKIETYSYICTGCLCSGSRACGIGPFLSCDLPCTREGTVPAKSHCFEFFDAVFAWVTHPPLYTNMLHYIVLLSFPLLMVLQHTDFVWASRGAAIFFFLVPVTGAWGPMWWQREVIPSRRAIQRQYRRGCSQDRG